MPDCKVWIVSFVGHIRDEIEVRILETDGNDGNYKDLKNRDVVNREGADLMCAYFMPKQLRDPRLNGT